MVAVFAALGIDGHADGAPLTRDAGREALLQFVTAVEVGFEGLFTALGADAPPVAGVTRESHTIRGDGGHEIRLHLDRPVGGEGPLPCIYQVHGGGMCTPRPSATSPASPGPFGSTCECPTRDEVTWMARPEGACSPGC